MVVLVLHIIKIIQTSEKDLLWCTVVIKGQVSVNYMVNFLLLTTDWFHSFPLLNLIYIYITNDYLSWCVVGNDVEDPDADTDETGGRRNLDWFMKN